MMKKLRVFLAALCAGAVLAVCLNGCGARGGAVCVLNEADPACFTCGGEDYTILQDTLPGEMAGAYLGDIRKLVAVDGQGQPAGVWDIGLSVSALAELAREAPAGTRTVQVLNVWTVPEDRDGAVAVVVDGVFHRAVPTRTLTEEEQVFSFAAPERAGEEAPFTVQPGDCRRLLCGETVYFVTDRPVAQAEQGAYIGLLSRACVFDADTGRALTRAQLVQIEPVPGPLSAQRRESRVYGAVYALTGEETARAVAVEVNGTLVRAEAERAEDG